MNQNKKILIITSWAPPMTGGPQNLYNLFSQFDDNSYCLLTGYQTISSHSVTGKKLGGNYYFFDAPVTKDSASFRIIKSNEDSFGIERSIIFKITYKFYKFIKHIPGVYFASYSLFSMGKTLAIFKEGLKVVKLENAKIILGISDNGPAMIAAHFISLYTKLPLVYYLYDIYKGNNLLPYDRLMSILWEKTIFNKATKIIVTNEGTKKFYHDRYPNLEIEVVHNSVFTSDYVKFRKPYHPKPPYKLIFTGHVYWAQEQAILNIIDSMRYLRDLPVELNLYIPKANPIIEDRVKDQSNIKILSAPQSKMPEIQSRAFLLVLPLAWGTKSPEIISTASPGKYTDYLASGRPMLVHAPNYAYVTMDVKKHGMGVVVDRNDTRYLAQRIRDFITNPSQAPKYIANSLKEFENNYSAEKNAIKIKRILTELF